MKYLSSALETGIKSLVIDELIALAKKNHIERLILFGSRARGDFSPKSDIDLAVSGGDKVAFALDAEEFTSTLLQFDIVDLDKEIQPKLLQSMEKEGVILYEKI